MWWVAAYVIQVTLVVALSIRDICRPQRAITWMVISLILPGLGLILYLILSRPLPIRRTRKAPLRHGKRDNSSPLIPLPSGLSKGLSEAVSRLSCDTPKPALVTLLGGGIATYDVLLTALAHAKRTIDIEYYIFRDDHIGKRVVDKLCNAAERGVRVRFIRDGWGSRPLSKRTLRKMAEAGIECRIFAPIALSSLQMLTHRDHCKIVVVDSEKALVGGINVGDEYTGVDPKVGAWQDADMLIEGEAVSQVAAVFETNYAAAEVDRKAHPVGQKGARRVVHLSHHRRPAMVEASVELADVDGIVKKLKPTPALVQTIESGPDSPMQRISQAFFLAVTMAQKSICLTTPYFAPDVDFSMALRTACMRGVRVRLLVPKKPDHKLIELASWTYFQPLIEAGIEIYLYEGAVLHAKLLAIDSEVSMIGAANCDMRSFRENYEVSSIVYDWRLANQLEAQFERDITHCHRLTLEMLQARSLVHHACQQGARLFASLL
jgi:cardiolipin synthase A/B